MSYHFQTEEAILARLGRYVGIETPSGNRDQMEKLNALMTEDLAEAGASVERVERPSGAVLKASIGEGDKQILLLGHRDTVFKMGDLAQNPYREETRDRETVLRGPGVLDMKAGDVMIVEMMRHFKDRLPEGWKLTALLNCDEEVGSHESEDLIREEARKSVCALVTEPSIPGMCTVARKGIGAYRIEAEGISAHSGVNYEKGASAIEALCHVISEIYGLRDLSRSITINIGSIEAPGKNNIISAKAVCRGEVRCFDTAYMKETLKKMEAICENEPVPGTKVKFIYTGGRPPMMQSDASRRLFEAAQASAKHHGLELKGRIHGGGSDGSYVADEGIPVLDGMGAEGDGAHTGGEYARKETLMKRLMVCCDVIESVIQGEC